MTLPFSSGYIRGGAHVRKDWDRHYMDRIMRQGLNLDPTPLDEALQLPIPKPTPDVSSTLLSSEKAPDMERGMAVQMGYTGDQCNNCNSMRMKVSGHCMVCEDCGTTTGCS